MTTQKIINAIAPTRICDVGGWTDTWFAKQGCILNIAVFPYVEVQIKINRDSDTNQRLVVNLENYGDSFNVNPEKIKYEKYPLIEAAIDSVNFPKDTCCEINIFSLMPPGASTGTSGAITVALIGALNSLTSEHLSFSEVARLAHEVETVKLKKQSGIQDQLCSAYGGINYIEMREYPYASVSPLRLSNSILWELERRLMLVYIGTPHDSSTVHKKVIDKLGDDAENSSYMKTLRSVAKNAKTKLSDGDFAGFGDCLNKNTQVQREMHPALVCDKFENIIEVCNDFNALGCKVNGAGGDGGTVTVLTDGDMNKKRILAEKLNETGFKVIPVYLDNQGLRVW